MRTHDANVRLFGRDSPKLDIVFEAPESLEEAREWDRLEDPDRDGISLLIGKYTIALQDKARYAADEPTTPIDEDSTEEELQAWLDDFVAAHVHSSRPSRGARAKDPEEMDEEEAAAYLEKLREAHPDLRAD